MDLEVGIPALHCFFQQSMGSAGPEVAVIGALSCIFSELDPLDEEHRWLACKRPA